ncbi:asparagine synthase (glutamine-hydrolyzing) [Membranihabitans marinus]|uniref:asparagine synthase (glutamine-hydrolyzing) n=1 Tax=Membranihabitans marinus TaxID=1227546 RepID=UPI0021D3F190|nr:asparagine synthase (glutamine-hydrolyzing) [Membranihabitans marinus]
MCSIALYHNPSIDPYIVESTLRQMSDLAQHRGPDHTGICMGEHCGMAHNRLSILDIHTRSNQPMYDENNVIIFNGCLFNFIEIRNELLSLGYMFKTESDTEVILKAYHAWGPQCLHKFNGMWAMAIYQKDCEQVFIARDRFGIKPLYYTHFDQHFALASEIKQLLPIAGTDLDIKNQNDYFLRGRLVHNNHTLYDKIKSFPAGHYGVYDILHQELKISRYYSIKKETVDPDPQQLLALFQDSVDIRLRSDVQVGVTVSGGIDSSVIALTVAELGAKSFKLYNAAFPDFVNDESPFAQILADEMHKPLHKNTVTWDSFIENLGNLGYLQDIPVGSFAVFASFLLKKKISSEGVKVILNGQGADEIFGGYTKFHYFHLKNLWRKDKVQFFQEFYSMGIKNQYPVETLKKKWNSFRNMRGNVDYDWYRSSHNEVWREDIVDSHVSPFQGDLYDVSQNALFGMGLPVMLHALDRNSMYHGIESRCPFLDYRLVEFVVNLPDDYKIREGVRKFMLREIFEGKLPEKLNKRYRKQGYTSPQNYFLKKNTTMIIKDIHDKKDLISEFIDINHFVKSMHKKPKWDLIWRVWTWLHWRETSLNQQHEVLKSLSQII